MLEIIAERKIAEHFKEGAVTRGFTDIFDIAGTDTFLTGGHTSSGRNLLSCKIRL